MDLLRAGLQGPPRFATERLEIEVLNILSRRLAYAQSTDCGNRVLHAAVGCTKSWRLFDEAGVRFLDGLGAV
jgi:hypothetical protein